MINKSDVASKILWVWPWDSKVSKSNVRFFSIFFFEVRIFTFIFLVRWANIPLSPSHHLRRSIGDHHPTLHCRQQSSASILLDQRFLFGGKTPFFYTSIFHHSLFLRRSFIFVVDELKPHYYGVTSGTNRLVFFEGAEPFLLLSKSFASKY